MSTDHQQREQRNAEFRNGLCGSSLAGFLGITKINAEILWQFDKAHMDCCLYLASYAMNEKLKARRVLEIVLEYGAI